MILRGISSVFASALALATPVYAVETHVLPGVQSAAGVSGGIIPPADDGSGQLREPAEGNSRYESRWLVDPPGPERRSLFVPTLEWTVAFSLTIPLFMIDPSFVHTGTISSDNFASAWTDPPEWDGDGFVANYVLHPIMGAEAYLIVRNRGYNPMESFLFATGVSFAWEYLFEAWVEQPSTQDLIVTSPVGAIQGEIRYQMRRWIAQWRPSLGRNALLVFVDPIEAIHRAVAADDDDEETMISSLDVGPGEARLNFTLQF
jgi:hypothetical protein